ncbi:TIGR00180 family glycosyltransferase [Allorhodopirellula solitaria]|uniref:Glycosyl transferase family 2 n=1 Tax=Allorhodopirellula solitaria TaxID=2527987 RepID=A0A5C5X043_9BACT|nr:TIGR00180 family glycosyltransferase [Allorhodopirellula solitaria]TWT56357.1 Glycosyl transferase family 2 [Allorhodopirellula solitaria]
MPDAVTLVVPTHNRTHFLRRLLLYLDQRSFDLPILVVDSSNAEAATENEVLIDSYCDRLRIRYRHSDQSFGTKCVAALGSVATPYTVFCADDDFLMPESVQKCVEFLEQNETYHCASGIWVQVEAKRSNRCSQFRCDQIDDDCPKRRFEKLAGNWFSNFYSVYRTEPLRRAWQVADGATDYNDARIFLELMLCQLGVIYGKTAVLPHTHYLFELHGDNDSSLLPLIANGEKANRLYDQFENSLAGELADSAGESPETAKHTVRKHYGYLRTGQSVKSNYRPTGVRKYARKLRQSVAKIRDGISRHPTKVWTRRRLRPGHVYLQSDAWRCAIEMTGRFPAGMNAEQLATERSRTPANHAAA